MKKITLIVLSLCAVVSQFFAQQRWELNDKGGITWNVKAGDNPHKDHIEMSGLKVSTVVRYGVAEDGSFLLNRGMVWPMLRTVPNDTHASLMRKMGWNPLENVLLGGYAIKEKVQSITLDGVMTVKSLCPVRGGNVELTRVLFPSTTKPAFIEKYTLKNIVENPVKVEVNKVRNKVKTPKERGTKGKYIIIQDLKSNIFKELKPQEEITFYVTTTGYEEGEKEFDFNYEAELQARRNLVNELWDNLVLKTPDPVINTMFAFAKIRGSESIYDTAGGLLHGPGGESYYAAIWANDQAEYINPFFPFLGYDKGNESALNAYNHFARFMNDEYKPLPSSIIAEGKIGRAHV